MIRGLQITGQSIDIELLRPSLIAFSKQFASQFGNASQQRVSKDTLVNMICCARDDAEEMLRTEAISNGMDARAVREGQECPSHPYMDPEQKQVWAGYVWEAPPRKEARGR